MSSAYRLSINQLHDRDRDDWQVASILDSMSLISLYTRMYESCRKLILLCASSSMRISFQSAYVAMMGIGAMPSCIRFLRIIYLESQTLLFHCGNGHTQANWAFVEVLIRSDMF
jgi:hypothetical protein